MEVSFIGCLGSPKLLLLLSVQRPCAGRGGAGGEGGERGKGAKKREKEVRFTDSACAEDLVLAEDRTTEADRELIMEGESTCQPPPGARHLAPATCHQPPGACHLPPGASHQLPPNLPVPHE